MDTYKRGMGEWHGPSAFHDWTARGVDVSGGKIGFGPGNELREGDAESPTVALPFHAKVFIPSWNADVPTGTKLEVRLSLRIADGSDAGRWTKFYSLGVWSLKRGERRSIAGQDDGDAQVLTDTVRATGWMDAYRLSVRLTRETEAEAPQVRALAVAFSSGKPREIPGEEAAVQPNIVAGGMEVQGVPSCSQKNFPEGAGWCSPTCLGMVAGYWHGRDFGGPKPMEERVRNAADGVFDAEYRGCGNWAFNAAYAASLGFRAKVALFASLDDLAPWIAAEIPVVVSVSWDQTGGRPLAGAPIERSNGHLTLLAGFDGAENPIVYDPVAAEDATVRRAYERSQFERRWLEASGGATYLIYPENWRIPG